VPQNACRVGADSRWNLVRCVKYDKRQNEDMNFFNSSNDNSHSYILEPMEKISIHVEENPGGHR